MITIVYHRHFHRVTMTGHAQSGEKGHDLVCAAASTLAYTLAANVAKLYAESPKHFRDPKLKLEEGDVEISCKVSHKYKGVITLVFDEICLGFEILKKNYPENISYEVRG